MMQQPNELLLKIEDMTAKNHELLDKTIFSLSAIFIGIIIGFARDLNAIILTVGLKFTMLTIIVSFILAIIFSAISYKLGAIEGSYLQINMNNNHQIHNAKLICKLGNYAEHTAFSFFILGLFAIVGFFILLFFPGLV